MFKKSLLLALAISLLHVGALRETGAQPNPPRPETLSPSTALTPQFGSLRITTVTTIILALAMSLPSTLPGSLQATDSSKTLPTVEQVLARYVQATGGSAAHQKLTTRVAKGEWENVTRGVRFPIEIYSKAPNKRVELLDAPENRGFTGRGYDGAAGWSMNMTETGLRPLEGAELATMQRESDFYREIRLDRLYQRLTVAGKERINGREVYSIEAIPESGNPEKLYFDCETGLLSRRDMVYGKTPVQHYYEDYRDIDGIKVPFVLRSEGPVRVITRLTEIKHNVPIEDARFKSPPSN
jgi:outer membrane lipoprotein-sorting protein